MSMQMFPDGASQVADPDAMFAKWAAVQVQKYESIPVGMETYDLKGGLYAVFIHNGPATDLSTHLMTGNTLKRCRKATMRWTRMRVKKSGFRFAPTTEHTN